MTIFRDSAQKYIYTLPMEKTIAPSQAYHKAKADRPGPILCEWTIQGDRRDDYFAKLERNLFLQKKASKHFLHRVNIITFGFLFLAGPAMCSGMVGDENFVIAIFLYCFYLSGAFAIYQYRKRRKQVSEPMVLHFFMDEDGFGQGGSYFPLGDIAYAGILDPKPQVHFDDDHSALCYLLRKETMSTEGSFGLLTFNYQEIPVASEVAPIVKETIKKWVQRERADSLPEDKIIGYRAKSYWESWKP